MKRTGENQLVLRLVLGGFASSSLIFASAFFGKRCSASSLSLSFWELVRVYALSCYKKRFNRRQTDGAHHLLLRDRLGVLEKHPEWGEAITKLEMALSTLTVNTGGRL